MPWNWYMSSCSSSATSSSKSELVVSMIETCTRVMKGCFGVECPHLVVVLVHQLLCQKNYYYSATIIRHQWQLVHQLPLPYWLDCTDKIHASILPSIAVPLQVIIGNQTMCAGQILSRSGARTGGPQTAYRTLIWLL